MSSSTASDILKLISNNKILLQETKENINIDRYQASTQYQIKLQQNLLNLIQQIHGNSSNLNNTNNNLLSNTAS